MKEFVSASESLSQKILLEVSDAGESGRKVVGHVCCTYYKTNCDCPDFIKDYH